MNKTAVVTGASSGMGRAVAIRLAQSGWDVAAVARRREALEQTAVLASEGRSRIAVFPCDVSRPEEVARMARAVTEQLGPVQVLVNAAGTNHPNRSLRELTWETYREITEVNLTGAYLCVQAFLPAMRERREGTIVNIVSDAGLRASAKAGVAYVVSKFGMAGLNQSINAEERANGIRACAIFPGDTDTPILEKRLNPPPPELRKLMLRPDDVAECVMLAINLPSRAVIEELVVRPR
jgi:NAD(P)-dependent dehydrogenase (short-subunit alcohol dehydrogenase family)